MDDFENDNLSSKSKSRTASPKPSGESKIFVWSGDNEGDKISGALDTVEPANDEASFHQKLPRTRSRDSPSTPRRKKVSAKEAYTAGFDYGEKSPSGMAVPAATGKDVIIQTPSSETESESEGSSSPAGFPEAVANPATYGMYDGDSESISSSCSWHVGIGKPESLGKCESDDNDFLLPTVIMSSALWDGKRKPMHTRYSSTVSLDENLVSSLSTPAGAKRRARSLGVGTLDLPITPKLFHSDASVSSNCSVGSHYSGFSHYSNGSTNQDGRHGDSIARLIHASAGDDYSHAPPRSDFEEHSETGSIGSLSTYVSDLEEKVHSLERKIETLTAENARAKREKLERRKKRVVSEIDRRNRELLVQDPALSRVFVLLLDPLRRKFELIQVLTNLDVATVRTVIQAIPENSTVPLMAKQKYRALCRPKDGIEMSEGSTPLGKVTGGWRVIRGEILIAIPLGYTGDECKKMAHPILHNPKLVSLLRRKDPLAPFAIQEISLPVAKDVKKDDSKTVIVTSVPNRTISRSSSKSGSRLRSKSLMSGQLKGAMLAARCAGSREIDETTVELDAMSRRRSSNLWSVHEDEIAKDEELAKDVEPSSTLMALQRLAQSSALCAESDGKEQAALSPSPRAKAHSKSECQKMQYKLSRASPDYGPQKSLRSPRSHAVPAPLPAFAIEAASQAFLTQGDNVSESSDSSKDKKVQKELSVDSSESAGDVKTSAIISNDSTDLSAATAEETADFVAEQDVVEELSGSTTEDAKQKVGSVQALAEETYKKVVAKLECVAEEDEEVSSCSTEGLDDDVSMTSATWNEQVSRAAVERSEVDLVGSLIDIVIEPEVASKGADKEYEKAPAKDSGLKNFLCAFSLLILLRIMAQGLFGIEVTASSAMGCKGVFLCVGMLKSLIHAQRGFEAYRAALKSPEGEEVSNQVPAGQHGILF
jgi:hypothetical protein